MLRHTRIDVWPGLGAQEIPGLPALRPATATRSINTGVAVRPLHSRVWNHDDRATFDTCDNGTNE